MNRQKPQFQSRFKGQSKDQLGNEVRKEPRNNSRKKIQEPLKKPLEKIEESLQEPEKEKDIPLHDTWFIYDHEKSNSNNYEKNTRILGQFSTLGEYQFLKNNLAVPSTLFYKTAIGKPYYVFSNESEEESKQPDPDDPEVFSETTREISSISLFRKGIKPKWEDPKNINGGEFSIRKFSSKGRDPFQCLDDYWHLLSAFCLCEKSSNSSSINGIRIVDSSDVAKKKQQFRIELWFSDNKYKEFFLNDLQILFGISDTDIYYKDHTPVANSSGSG